jgi:CheY-like chemotaxis protein
MPATELTLSYLPRILIIDDNQDIHRDFRLAFVRESPNPDLQASEDLVFPGEIKHNFAQPAYELEHALSGLEGIERLRQSLAKARPFQLAFVDIRMPGIDGVETVSRLWQIDPSIQIVLVTAYADYSWDELVTRLGYTDKLLMLKKPFEYIEVIQMASTLAEKWFLGRQAALKLEQMELLVAKRTHKLLELQRPDAGNSKLAQPAPLEITEGSACNKEPPLVIVVEADAHDALHIVQGLEPEFRILAAKEGKAALERTRETVPDLIIASILLPGLSGIELCRHLKCDELTSHIPVILLGASEIRRVDALEAGADDYLAKPFSQAVLRARASGLLQSRRNLQELVRHESLIEPRDLATNQFDAQFLRRTTEIVEKHLADFEFDVETLSRALFMSRRQLLRKLKAVVGYAPNSFIRTLRLKRAAELLKTSGMTVTEITYAVGFSDLKHFRTLFRNHFGALPAEYARAADLPRGGEAPVGQPFQASGSGRFPAHWS